MAILLDIKGHLVSDRSLDELHRFAQDVGLRRSWFQGKSKIPHYDLTSWRMRRRAMKEGANKVSPREIVKRGVRA